MSWNKRATKIAFSALEFLNNNINISLTSRYFVTVLCVWRQNRYTLTHKACVARLTTTTYPGDNMDFFKTGDAPAAAGVSVDAVSAWLASAYGQQKIHESLSQSEAAVDVLAKARVVDPRELHEPVTV